MRKKINTIKITAEADSILPSLVNYTHFYFEKGGIVLSSNKNKDFNIPRLFIKYADIVVLTFY
jgi:hypothetical protein